MNYDETVDRRGRKRVMLPRTLLIASSLASIGPALAAVPDTGIITQQVVAPDGMPAQGAAVHIALYGDNDPRAPIEEGDLTTGQGGRFTFQVDGTKVYGKGLLQAVIGLRYGDACFSVERLGPFLFGVAPEPLHLSAGNTYLADIRTYDGRPVSHPVVTFKTIGNDADLALAAQPWLVAHCTTDNDVTAPGRFTAGPISIGDPSNHPAAYIVASADIDGRPWMGQGIAEFPSERANVPVVPLYPTQRIHGTVTSAATGAPIAGARVQVASESVIPFAMPAPTVTDADGHYEFAAVPPVYGAKVTFTAPGTVPGAAEYAMVQSALHGGQPSKETEVQVDAGLLDWTTVSGHVIDAVTGLALDKGEPDLCQIVLEADSVRSDTHPWLARFSATPLPDGSFRARVPAGKASLEFEGMVLGAEHLPARIDIPSRGISDLTIPVAKQPCFYFRFKHNSGSFLEFHFQLRRPDGKVEDHWLSNQGGFGSWAGDVGWGLRGSVVKAAKWGDTLEVRADGTPWTTLTADPRNWPQVVDVGDAQGLGAAF